jgi:hypothetical protein
VTLAGCHALYQQISGRFDAAVIPDHINVEGAFQPPRVIWVIEIGRNRHHSKPLLPQSFALTFAEPH